MSKKSQPVSKGGNLEPQLAAFLDLMQQPLRVTIFIRRDGRYAFGPVEPFDEKNELHTLPEDPEEFPAPWAISRERPGYLG